MPALAALMVQEKTGRKGQKAVAPIGITFLALGAWTLVAPSLSPLS